MRKDLGERSGQSCKHTSEELAVDHRVDVNPNLWLPLFSSYFFHPIEDLLPWNGIKINGHNQLFRMKSQKIQTDLMLSDDLKLN